MDSDTVENRKIAKIISVKPRNNHLRRSLKGDTKDFRYSRKINNMGINRQLVPNLPNCALQCRVKISQEECQEAWNEFKGFTDISYRLKYLGNLIQIFTPNRSRVPESKRKVQRSCSNKYYLKYIEELDNSRYQMCKMCFLTVFNLTRSKIRTIIDKKLNQGENIQYNRGKAKVNKYENGEKEQNPDENMKETPSDPGSPQSRSVDDKFPVEISNVIQEVPSTRDVTTLTDDTNILGICFSRNKTRNKPSKKGETREYRDSRKIKNLGITRELVPALSQCAFNCLTKTTQEERQKVWNEFRGFTDIGYRLKYLGNLIQTFTPNRSRVLKSKRKVQRSCSNKYYLKYIDELDNSRYQMCKICFITVFNLTRGKIRTVVEKKLNERENIQNSIGVKSDGFPTKLKRDEVMSVDCKNEEKHISIEVDTEDVPNVPITNDICESKMVMEDLETDYLQTILKEELSKKRKTKEFQSDRRSKRIKINSQNLQDNQEIPIGIQEKTLFQSNDYEQFSEIQFLAVNEDHSIENLSLNVEPDFFMNDVDSSQPLINEEVVSLTSENYKKPSKIENSKAFRDARKLKNLGINRKLVPNLTSCSKECHTKSSKEERQKVWSQFRQYTDINQRFEYLSKLMKMKLPSRRVVSRKNRIKDRSRTITFYLKWDKSADNSKNILCKICFMSVFNLTPSKIRTMSDKIFNETGKNAVETILFNSDDKISTADIVKMKYPLDKIEEEVTIKTPQRREKVSAKGDTQKFRLARKIKNLGVDRDLAPQLSKCSFDCINKTSTEERQETWDEFRKLLDLNTRLHYLSNLVKIRPPNRCRRNAKLKRGLINTYFLRYDENEDNSRYKLCKICFATIFNLSQSRIRTITSKKVQTYMGIEMEYRRGKNSTSSKKAALKLVRTEKKIKIDRELVPDLALCNFHCKDKTSKVERQAVWDEFRALNKTHKSRELANLIQTTLILGQNERQIPKCTNDYHLRYNEFLDNAQYQICKKCFMMVFDIKEIEIREILRKKAENVMLRMQDEHTKVTILKEESIDTFDTIFVKEEYRL